MGSFGLRMLGCGMILFGVLMGVLKFLDVPQLEFGYKEFLAAVDKGMPGFALGVVCIAMASLMHRLQQIESKLAMPKESASPKA